jgi:hypothetical protein
MLIIVLAWPHATLPELALRGLVALPLMALLLAISAPLDLLGNLQELVARQVEPNGLQPLYLWAKVLEGGGDMALAAGLAGVTIMAAVWLAEKLRAHSVTHN